MKRTVAALITFALAACGSAFAGMEHEAAAKKHVAFEALKALEGTWTGKAGHAGGETSDATIVYKMTGAGSVLAERLFPGTPHEMVTMYHLDGDDVVLTHYCAAGNQPRMKLASSDGKSFAFAFAGGTNIKEGDTHMHDGKLTILGADRMKAEWTGWSGGKADHTMVFELTRRK